MSIPTAGARGSSPITSMLPVATSPSWAGYVVRAEGRAFTQVVGSWTQPRIDCERPDSSVAFWIGIGGAERASRALEQLGTTAGCTGTASPWYSAWYQLFPDVSVDIPIPISPGDVIVARLSINARKVALELRNRTTGASFARVVSASKTEAASAEWIVEAPATCLPPDCLPTSLAHFVSAAFVGAVAHAGSLEGSPGADVWSTEPLEMRLPGGVVVVPSRVSRGGSSFSVATLAAPAGSRMVRP